VVGTACGVTTPVNPKTTDPVLASITDGSYKMNVRKHPTFGHYCVSFLDSEDTLLAFRRFETLPEALEFGKTTFGN
jgi:hypothetical protein